MVFGRRLLDLCVKFHGQGKAGTGRVVVDVAGDGGQRGAQVGGCLGLVGGGERDQQRAVELGVEDGDADAVGGEGVAVAAGQPLDEPGQAQSPEVVGHLAGALVAAEQPGDHGTEALVGEAGRGEQRLAQGAGQGHDPRIAEPQGLGSSAPPGQRWNAQSAQRLDSQGRSPDRHVQLAGSAGCKHGPWPAVGRGGKPGVAA
jgi:hypothetical protein